MLFHTILIFHTYIWGVLAVYGALKNIDYGNESSRFQKSYTWPKLVWLETKKLIRQ